MDTILDLLIGLGLTLVLFAVVAVVMYYSKWPTGSGQMEAVSEERESSADRELRRLRADHERLVAELKRNAPTADDRRRLEREVGHWQDRLQALEMSYMGVTQMHRQSSGPAGPSYGLSYALVSRHVGAKRVLEERLRLAKEAADKEVADQAAAEKASAAAKKAASKKKKAASSA